jgi:predicted RNA-binding Zn-ribbon protein involved in translation (DUF1610 family)
MMITLEEAQQWSCDACGKPLVMREVEFYYLNGSFHVNLPACPECGLVFINEALATGKMAEVEGILEDK